MGRSVWMALLLALCAFQPAQSLELSLKGSNVYLSGLINLGDNAKFEAFLLVNRGKSLRMVHLDSPGGWSGDMQEIARAIRKAGLSTAVDASRATCASACTVLFAAGVQRYYYNAERISEGVRKADTAPGLGYHGASNSRSTIISGGQGPGTGTQQVINMYYEMGSGQAAKLVTQADPSQLYMINGQTALSMGIATSTSRP